jgi:hypothetical protein
MACIGMRMYSASTVIITNTRLSYMFHQANMRVNDVPTATLNGKRGQYSLLMIWTETVAQEMMRM